MSKTGFKKGRLGIGTDNPRYPLDVVGDIRLTGGFRDASGNDFNFLAINNVDYIKQEDINGITSSNSKIGILNTNPSEELDVSGNINFTGTLKQNGVAFGGGKFEDAATSGDIYYTSGKVGIGYASPAHSLEVRTSSGWAGAFKGQDNDVMVYIAQKGYGLAVDSKAQKSSTSYIAKFRGSTNGTTIGNRPIMDIMNSGNVGIGTTDPGNFKLKIYNSTGTNTNGSNGWHNHFCVEEQSLAGSGVTFKAGTETGYIYYGSSTGNPWVGSGSFGFATTATGNSSDIKMVLKNDGNLGIGTTIPLHKLHVANLEISNTMQDLICLETQTSSEAGHPAVSGIAQGILFKNKWHTNATKYSMARISAHSQPGYGGQLSFWTNNGAGSPDDTLLERLRINEDGYVGIGTTDPGARLHVEVPGYGEPIAKFSGVGDTFILIEGGRTNDWDEVGVVIRGMPTGGYWLAGVDDSSTYQIKYDTDFHFGNEGVGLAIKTDGNVGIGTTTPAGKLEIANASSVTSYQDHANTSIIMRNPTSTADFNSSITWTDHTPNSWGHQSMLGITGNCGASHGLSLWGFNGRRISLCSIDNSTDSTPWDSPSLTVWQNKVGIGTTTPEYPLQVSGTSSSTIDLDTAYFSVCNISEPNYGRYGLYMGAHAGSGHGWIQTGRTGTSNSASLGEQFDMFLQPVAGNVAIGTASASYKLDVNGNGRFKNHLRIDGGSSNNGGDTHFYITKSTNNDWAMRCDHGSYDYGIKLNGSGSHAIHVYNGTTSALQIQYNGHIHMKTSWFHVDGYYTPNIGSARYFHLNGANVSSSDSYGAYSLSIHARYGIFSDEHIWAGSDRRIKKDIRAVPDDLALDTLRSIECYYYKYIDGTRGEGDTIGFMAQEVAEKLPIAVKQTEKIIPNIYKVISCNWTSFVETTVDASGNTTSETKYKMSSNEITGDISGVLYRFYLYENDFQDTQDEKEEDIIGNADNTFTFSEKHDTVFCYGYQVNDFHVINKDKLYSLNFSATQELDRQQQADKLRIAELEQEVNELKTIVHALKNHLGLS